MVRFELIRVWSCQMQVCYVAWVLLAACVLFVVAPIAFKVPYACLALFDLLALTASVSLFFSFYVYCVSVRALACRLSAKR